MSAEVYQASAVEPYEIKMSSKNTSSGTSTTGPKASIFAAKPGFVIPRNKLSGSLVPIFRGKKPGGNDAATDDSTNQVIRKSKWGPDPTQDAAVRKGRALAYQTRVDQIMQQLKSGTLQPWENQDSQLADQPTDPRSSAPPIDSKDLELLKLERREIIGEILKLNPSFKTPPDYEPLLKEATIPIHVKDHPGINFVSLIFGRGGETQSRIEKETKAKIQVFGAQVNAGEKVEIFASDGAETQVAYEELNVHVSADTFEKVDGAVALIELLVTSILGNSGNSQNAYNQNQDTSTLSMAPSGEQGVEQSIVAPTQTPPQGLFQFQTPGHLSHGFNPIQNFPAPIQNNPLPVHSTPLNAINMPSLFGHRPIQASGFSSIMPSTSLVPSRPQMPMQVSSHPYPPRNFAPQVSSAQANISASLPFIANQNPSALPFPVAGPLVSSSSLPVSAGTPGPQFDRLLTPAGSSSGWPTSSAIGSASLGSGNIGQVVPPMTPFRGPIQQPGFLSSTPASNVPAANAIAAVSFSPGQSTVNVPANHPPGALNFASVPSPQMGSSSAPPPIKSPSVGMAAAPVPGSMPNSSPATSTSQPSLQLGMVGSFPGNTSNLTLIRPPPTITASKPLHSGPGDFTFRPHHLQNPASLLRPSSQPMNQESSLLRPPMQTPSPHAPSFGVAVPNSIPSPHMHVFPRPQVGNQMGQAQAHVSSIPFAGISTGTSIPPRGPAFLNANPVIPPARNFNAVPQRPGLAGPFSPMPGNTVQVQQNYPAPRPSNFIVPNQKASTNLSFASNPGGQQIYDPFSPTSASTASR